MLVPQQILFSQYSRELYEGRMASSGMLRRVALVRTDVSEKLSASFIRVTRIGELETTLAVTSNRRTLLMEALNSSETSVLTRATQRNNPEDTILQEQNSLYGEPDRMVSSVRRYHSTWDVNISQPLQVNILADRGTDTDS
jgi:hypothetical protein